jgi:hypothetical protein
MNRLAWRYAPTGQTKDRQTDRVILVPGPELELETVQKTYELNCSLFDVKRNARLWGVLNGRGIVGEKRRSVDTRDSPPGLTNPRLHRCEPLQSAFLQAELQTRSKSESYLRIEQKPG